MLRFLFLLIFLLGITISSNAQTRGQGRPGGGAGISITGKVVEGDAKQALEYATISLIAMKDSSVAAGEITNAKGQFFMKSRPGKYFMKVEFLGFEPTVIEDISIQSGQES